jgi:hypothetical protein
MRIDPLKQYAQLRQQLLAEKNHLEARLLEINEVLGSETTPAPAQPAMRRTPGRRGPRGASQLSLREAIMQALAERGPLSRKELAAAVQDLGYVSHAKDPLNSMGVVLYARNAPFKKKDGKFYLPAGAAAGMSRNNGGEPTARRRTMSPEARGRISAAQKARWARQRKGN